jgi:Esterase-like activity of phytase
LTLAAPASAHPRSLGSCSPDVDLLSFSDTLDKTSFQGTSVGGLSALSLTHGGARAIVDNQGTTQARCYDVAFGKQGPKVTKVTPLTQPDGTPFTGQNLDGEGLVAARGR